MHTSELVLNKRADFFFQRCCPPIRETDCNLSVFLFYDFLVKWFFGQIEKNVVIRNSSADKPKLLTIRESNQYWEGSKIDSFFKHSNLLHIHEIWQDWSAKSSDWTNTQLFSRFTCRCKSKSTGIKKTAWRSHFTSPWRRTWSFRRATDSSPWRRAIGTTSLNRYAQMPLHRR